MIYNSADAWFASKTWRPFPFQRSVWEHIRHGKNGLLNAPTGSGKTYAVLLGALERERLRGGLDRKGLRLIWVTPLRALAVDLALAMATALQELGLPWSVQTRTGDTPASDRKSQDKKLPEILITTPESLHLLLARPNHETLFEGLQYLVLDEWHELLGTKRGVMAELAVARLRRLQPAARVWAISATIGNLEEASAVALAPCGGEPKALVRADSAKELHIEPVLPDTIDRFPWAGHLGTTLVHKVLPIIARHTSTLLFTNTRSQAEIWYRQLLEADPDLAGVMALHHGSIDRDVRSWVEQALRDGQLKAVVCTSSLDLGVDFHPVECVVQVGSPKGVARFLQRAGRSGHRPGQASKLFFVPTHALELIELSAFRRAIEEGYIESRQPVLNPIDVLVQYLTTRAVGGGFEAAEALDEVRSTFAFASLPDADWEAALDLITTGGAALRSNPDFRRVEVVDGKYRVTDRRIARHHRLSIGTIVSDMAIRVKFQSGGYLGSIEESFISKLSPGDHFWFAGRNLELLRFKDQTAYVRRSNARQGTVPQWMGGRMPLSTELSEVLRAQIHTIAGSPGQLPPDAAMLAPLLELQAQRSLLPGADTFLIESVHSREGHHLFFYPFEGRLVHEGMAALWATRIGRIHKMSFSLAMNDYGFELLSDRDIPIHEALDRGLLSTENFFQDIDECMNASEMGQRRFREVARISGLVFQGYPGAMKTDRNLQSSAGLLYEVFRKYAPSNILLRQANDEVVQYQLEGQRLLDTLRRIGRQTARVQESRRFTPFSFPIMVDRLREKMTFEKLMDRIQRMTREAER